jgi:hypothetical protein
MNRRGGIKRSKLLSPLKMMKGKEFIFFIYYYEKLDKCTVSNQGKP